MNITNTQDALEYIRQNRDILRGLIRQYHPASKKRDQNRLLNLTAPSAEIACAIVRDAIKDEQRTELAPDLRFDAAIEDGNYGKLYALLQDAWYGVPESTECWSIKGFAETVDILEQPVHDEYV